MCIIRSDACAFVCVSFVTMRATQHCMAVCVNTSFIIRSADATCYREGQSSSYRVRLGAIACSVLFDRLAFLFDGECIVYIGVVAERPDVITTCFALLVGPSFFSNANFKRLCDGLAYAYL